MMLHNAYHTFTASCLFALILAAVPAQAAKSQPENILFVIMDDVGIDQMQKTFGYGTEDTSPSPIMDTIASSGLRFTDVWSMPECSPARVTMFTGRYPLRTHVYSLIQSLDLANSQLSPYEITVPKVLKHAGYTSALFGKHHMGGPFNNPYGDQTPTSFGFDYFHGPMGGTNAGAAPDPIDTTAGGVAPEGTYTCGFVPNTDADGVNGADNGACYFADGGCNEISRTSSVPHPGRACLEQGGILVPNAPCEDNPPANLNFGVTNAYYVWSLGQTDSAGTIDQIPLTDPRSRTYWPTEITTAAIEWINAHKNGPWMVTVSYPSIHAPYQQAPQSLTPDYGDLGAVPCDEEAPTLSSQMLQAMDTEIGRLLVETGLASRSSDGQFRYTPDASNTMIVIVGDNGSYGPIVKTPFDWTRAKGTVFQTGVWVPLIVAGPLVHSPNRAVGSMVNVADLFELFGEIAGVDVRKIVPRSRVLDSVSMLPYLTQPSRPSLRQYNFAQQAINFTANGQRPGPCVLPMALFTDLGSGKTCMQLMIDKATCESEGGEWYGDSYSSCCELKRNRPDLQLQGRWLSQEAVRNDKFKLVQMTYDNCFATEQSPEPTVTVFSFYEINQEEIPQLDTIYSNLLTSPQDPLQGLTQEQAKNFKRLERELNRVLASDVMCPGDGNNDGVVDEEDISNWSSFNAMDSISSWYDFPVIDNGTYVYDGVTNGSDLQVILDNLGRRCRQTDTHS